VLRFVIVDVVEVKVGIFALVRVAVVEENVSIIPTLQSKFSTTALLISAVSTTR
jgi:hypothetical protein